ncbi:DUF3008 family protein [Paraburkholderia sp. SIMBA_054]|uniref:DUF3008 family protein n=1 Tax=Paraburkholderia sp. SIMBA_054 TaxID=3085795 RepID=UPI00397E3E2E
MPAKSKAQQMAAGVALAAKKGEKPESELKGAAKSMYESMTEKQLEELASTSQKDKPTHKSE